MVQRRAFRNGRRDDLVPNCSDEDGNHDCTMGMKTCSSKIHTVPI